MGFLELFILAVGLAMDAFAVSICKGLTLKRADGVSMAKCGLWFGGFQALMPTIGFFLGTLYADASQSIDHWVAFVLLAIIGVNMLKEALEKECDCCDENADFSVKTMFLMAIATSIDALAVGITFATMSVSVLFASSIIGIITFFICLFGVYLGSWCGNILGNKADLTGGLVLLGIGIKILIEHLFFA